jgi:prepilin-type processing-associated H-X9-DG protein
MSYADSWKGWAPQPYDGVKTWGDVLANSEGITNRNSMVCPSAKPNVFTSFSNTYGMWAYENTYATNLGGNFKGTQGIPYTAKGPGSQIFIADSGSASTDQTQVYYIYGWVSSMRFFDLRHSMRCNAFFADGHAAGFGAAQTRELGIRYYMINSSVLENTPPVP